MLMAVKFFRFIWEYFKINLQSAMEYRVNFLTQSLFMFLNDIIWVIFWFIFFSKFPIINDWGFKDIMTMMIVITTSWGLVGIFFGNFRYLAEVIRDGQLDFYLALPKEELTHILVSKSKFDAFGDVFFGIALAFLFIPFAKVPLLIALLLLSCIIILSFAIILGSLSFYLGSSSEVSNQGLMGVLSIASYPFSPFEGYTKFLLLTLIPAGFITGIPVELLKVFNLQWFLLMILCAIVLLTIAILFFKHGVKKYESGNLINVRM
jgi:ABC-2 type transport system permease protein